MDKAENRELMNAEEAADFLRMSYSEFRKRAPEFPRYAISERRYVYWRPELLEWVLCNREANANEHQPTVSHKTRSYPPPPGEYWARYGA